MKVAIIGGGGRVGSCAAFALQCSGIVKEIVLLDANQAAAEGEALDLLHGAAYCADQNISAGHYADCADAGIICITVSVFGGIMKSIKEAGLRREAIVMVVSNPVDILTQLAVEQTGLGPG